MYCTQCGGNITDDQPACPRCGAPRSQPGPPPQQQYPQQPPQWQQQQPPPPPGPSQNWSPGWNAPPAGHNFQFNPSRWSTADMITGGASFILLIALFLPWFSVSFGPLGSASVSGTTSHGFLWLVFLVVLAILSYLVLTAGFQPLPFRPPLRHEQLLLIATGLNLLLVLIAFADIPSSNFVKVGWAFGAVLALIAAVAAVVPIARTGFQQFQARGRA